MENMHNLYVFSLKYRCVFLHPFYACVNAAKCCMASVSAILRAQVFVYVVAGGRYKLCKNRWKCANLCVQVFGWNVRFNAFFYFVCYKVTWKPAWLSTPRCDHCQVFCFQKEINSVWGYTHFPQCILEVI